MSAANSIAFRSPQFSVLSESQMRDLHLAALEVLRRTGVRFYHTGALELLEVAGIARDRQLVQVRDERWGRRSTRAAGSVPVRRAMASTQR